MLDNTAEPGNGEDGLEPEQPEETPTPAKPDEPQPSAESQTAAQPPTPAEPKSEAPRPHIYMLRALLDAWDADADAQYAAWESGQPVGPVTGLPMVDELLGGAISPGLHMIHGSPGIGKTAFALQIACECGCPALFVTCEMAPLELLRRITSRVTGTYLGRFKTGELEPQLSKSLVRRAAERYPHFAILDLSKAYASALPNNQRNQPSMLDIIDSLRAQTKTAHILVIIDSLHSWTSKAPAGASEYEQLNAGIIALGSLAAQATCPVLVVVERNRASMQGGGLSGGAGTRKIEYSAETVIELDAHADGTATGEREVALSLSKNRNGATGRKVNLRFIGKVQQYIEDGL